MRYLPSWASTLSNAMGPNWRRFAEKRFELRDALKARIMQGGYDHEPDHLAQRLYYASHTMFDQAMASDAAMMANPLRKSSILNAVASPLRLLRRQPSFVNPLGLDYVGHGFGLSVVKDERSSDMYALRIIQTQGQEIVILPVSHNVEDVQNAFRNAADLINTGLSLNQIIDAMRLVLAPGLIQLHRFALRQISPVNPIINEGDGIIIYETDKEGKSTMIGVGTVKEVSGKKDIFDSITGRPYSQDPRFSKLQYEIVDLDTYLAFVDIYFKKYERNDMLIWDTLFNGANSDGYKLVQMLMTRIFPYVKFTDAQRYKLTQLNKRINEILKEPYPQGMANANNQENFDRYLGSAQRMLEEMDKRSNKDSKKVYFKAAARAMLRVIDNPLSIQKKDKNESKEAKRERVDRMLVRKEKIENMENRIKELARIFASADAAMVPKRSAKSIHQGAQADERAQLLEAVRVLRQSMEGLSEEDKGSVQVQIRRMIRKVNRLENSLGWQKTPYDSAQAAMPGGIDLNSANLNLQIKRDGRGVPLPLSQQDMAQLSTIQGFVPVILEIKPAVDLPILSELKQGLQNHP